MDALLADGFTEVTRSGRIIDKAEAIAQLIDNSGVEPERAVHQFRLSVIGQGVVIATYWLVEEGATDTPRAPTWVFTKEGRWRMAFHQAIPVVH